MARLDALRDEDIDLELEDAPTPDLAAWVRDAVPFSRHTPRLTAELVPGPIQRLRQAPVGTGPADGEPVSEGTERTEQ